MIYCIPDLSFVPMYNLLSVALMFDLFYAKRVKWTTKFGEKGCIVNIQWLSLLGLPTWVVCDCFIPTFDCHRRIDYRLTEECVVHWVFSIKSWWDKLDALILIGVLSHISMQMCFKVENKKLIQKLYSVQFVVTLKQLVTAMRDVMMIWFKQMFDHISTCQHVIHK